MSNIDEKFDKAEKVVARTQKLVLKIIGGLVAIGLAIFVGLEQLGGEEPIDEGYEQEYYEEDSLDYETDIFDYEEAQGY